MTTLIDQGAEPAAEDQSRTEALVERLLGSLIGGAELLSIELGRRLGLYEVLAGSGGATAAGLAQATGVAPRYLDEWLSQQVVAGFLERDDDGHHHLPAEHVPVLLDEDSLANQLGAGQLLGALARTIPAVAQAYGAGTGVAYSEFGADFAAGIAALNRPQFLHLMRAWVGELPDVAARLEGGGTVLDAGCGHGWSSIGLAQAFPDVRVVGVDLDERSIESARVRAAGLGLADRITFVHANATDEEVLRAAAPEGYDLVTVFQALHDMGEPDAALRTFRALLTAGGAVLVGDEHSVEVTGDPVARLQLAFSAMHCVPATSAESQRVVNGTVLRPHTLLDWAEQAGFASVAELDIEHPLWRFYRIPDRS
jgi:ubiquinone/menaquinone biosynthesis C-methylase UbiE